MNKLVLILPVFFSCEKYAYKSDVVTHAYNPGTWEDKAKHYKFKANLWYTTKYCQQNKNLNVGMIKHRFTFMAHICKL